MCKLTMDDRHGLAMTLETLAWMATECGRHERAAILLGCAERVRDQIAVTLMELHRQQHERSVLIIVGGSARRRLTRHSPAAAR